MPPLTPWRPVLLLLLQSHSAPQALAPLPDCLPGLTALQRLSLAHCGLSSLPAGVTALPGLTQLELQVRGCGFWGRGGGEGAGACQGHKQCVAAGSHAAMAPWLLVAAPVCSPACPAPPQLSPHARLPCRATAWPACLA